MNQPLLNHNVIEPGLGAGGISLFAPRLVVESSIGKPNDESKFFDTEDAENVTWLNYYDLGLDICVSNSSSIVTALSLHRGGISQHKAFAGQTSDGLCPGSSEVDIVRSLGPPDESGKSHVYHDGRRSRRWISYQIGVGFELSLLDDRVDLIAIYPPQLPITRRHHDGK